MSALDKLKKNTTIKESEVLTHSKFFNQKNLCRLRFLLSTYTVWSVRWRTEFWSYCFRRSSKHFKTAFAMLLAKAYLDKYDDAVILFLRFRIRCSPRIL